MINTRALLSSWTGPGILQLFFSIKDSSSSIFPAEVLERWLDDTYIPAFVDSGAVKSAWRFRAANETYSKQHMMIFEFPDLAQALSPDLLCIPRTSETFPTNEPLDEWVEAEVRVLSFVQLYETSKHTEDAVSTVIYAAMEPPPGGEAELEAWYREEHNQQMSEQPGWIRTTRFRLLNHHRTHPRESEKYSFLAIHEFGEGHGIGKDVAPLEPMTEWTKKCMAAAKATDAAVYHTQKVFGEASEEQ